jgi:L-lactate dehydrogenase complex protein LldG
VSTRERILERVRRGAERVVRHPGAHPSPAGLPAGWPAFAERLASVGGEAHGPFGPAEVGGVALSIARRHAPDGRIVAEPSAMAALGQVRIAAAAAGAAPETFADVAAAVVLGSVGVAENGAVAVLGRNAPNRALPFLCQHLILLLDAEAIVADLHEAFARLPEDALEHHHLTWISGPSKTADIEQTLVHGAHGPLTLDVVGIH